MKKDKKIRVPATSHGERVDIFLSEYLDISRSQIQKLIEQNQILINDKLPKKAGDRVKEDDVVVYHCKPSPLTGGEAKKSLRSKNKFVKYGSSKIEEIITSAHTSLPHNETIEKVKIIFETPEYVVVDKPSGLLTHPTMAEEKISLASFLVKKFPEMKTVGEDPLRPGIVHRLDKEASGLLVAARTPEMFKQLKTQFKNRTIEKEYLVLVHGRVAKEEDTISFPIARGRTNERMSARPLSVGAPLVGAHTSTLDEKEALTEFIVEQRFVNFTLLRVKIHTGRMHQIRVHLLAYNHPVVGDQLYTQKKRKRTWDDRLDRLFLHATKLTFTDTAGIHQTFYSPLPPQLANFLTILA